jgi:hypothetical protein
MYTPKRRSRVFCSVLGSSFEVIHPPPDQKKTESEKADEADAEILEAIKSRRKLASDMELAKGIEYTESLKTRYAARVLPRLAPDIT